MLAGGVIAKEMAQGTAEHKYRCLPAFSYMIDALNIGTTYSIMKLKSIVDDGPDLCFISDRHKSIANGLAKNTSINYNLTKAYSSEKFSDHFVESKNYCPEAAFFLKKELGFEKWSRACFLGNKFDMMTINIFESVNAMLIAEKEYPMASIFNSIAKSFGEIFRERRAHVLKCKDNKFVPTAKKILRDNKSKGGSFNVENISGDERQYIVFGSSCTTKVDLLEMSCSYRKFDLVKISCDHTMAAFRLKHNEDYGLRVYDYSSPLYKVEEYLLAYSESINVIPLESE
ncbi:hypothetical protein BC332_21124 [Capsicum chinense]|nr:hypothetical protein BC332_21124 [Capsicum chinense]